LLNRNGIEDVCKFQVFTIGIYLTRSRHHTIYLEHVAEFRVPILRRLFAKLFEFDMQ
jgi:hypothetical protein